MAGKKDQSVVIVGKGLTATQASNIHSDIIKSKNKHAPNASFTSAIQNEKDIGLAISNGTEKLKLSGGNGNGKKQ